MVIFINRKIPVYFFVHHRNLLIKLVTKCTYIFVLLRLCWKLKEKPAQDKQQTTFALRSYYIKNIKTEN